MTDLHIELDQITLRPEIIEVICEELKAGGLTAGMFSVGAIANVPNSVYFLWHLSGAAPVSMLIRRDQVDTEAGARVAASDYLRKWSKRLQ